MLTAFSKLSLILFLEKYINIDTSLTSRKTTITITFDKIIYRVLALSAISWILTKIALNHIILNLNTFSRRLTHTSILIILKHFVIYLKKNILLAILKQSFTHPVLS